jgi:hypothetical protein
MIQPSVPRKSWFPLRARSGFDQSVRPRHPVDPVDKSVLRKPDGKLNNTGTRQQFTLDQQLRGGSSPGQKPKGSQSHSR